MSGKVRRSSRLAAMMSGRACPSDGPIIVSGGSASIPHGDRARSNEHCKILICVAVTVVQIHLVKS